jgi:2-aminoadipate transaminase
MIQDIEKLFSKTANNMKRSAIREILKLTQQPDIISFAGGLPSPESFPVEDVKKISEKVLTEKGITALQYGTTDGCIELREQLSQKYKREGLNIDIKNILITTSSQQGLDLLGKILINPGDKVICGLPSYLGGISAFGAYGADLLGIKFDEHGMRSDKLGETLESLNQQYIRPKFIYIIPDFQNPAGITMPEFRRREILELAYKYNVLIIEDSPYRELRFDGKPQKMIYELDNKGYVLTLGTFSKILAPGFRMGWVLGNDQLIDKLIVAKQSTDLCTPAFLQLIIAEYMKQGLLEKNLLKTIDAYREKRDLMLKCFRDMMPEGVTWTEPEGGLFLFLNLPEKMDASELFHIAIEKKVAFVIGQVFHCDGSGKNTMRFNFSFASKEQICTGIKRLSEAIKDMMK